MEKASPRVLPQRKASLLIVFIIPTLSPGGLRLGIVFDLGYQFCLGKILRHNSVIKVNLEIKPI
jgi:hypothetical protein